MRREEEEERYNVLAAVASGDKGAQLLAKASLVTNKRFACVGTLREGQFTVRLYSSVFRRKYKRAY